MMQEAGAPVDDGAAWEFDLGDVVTLLWSGASGQVIGRTEYVHKDQQYLVEYVNDVGVLTQQWVYGSAIDIAGTVN